MVREGKKYYKTGIKVLTSNFRYKWGNWVYNHPQSEDFNQRIKDVLAEESAPKKEKTLLDCFLEYSQLIEVKNSKGYMKRFKTLITSIRLIGDCGLKELNTPYLLSLEKHFRERGNRLNTIHKKFVVIKTVLNYAVGERYVKENPAIKYRTRTATAIRKPIELDELGKLITVELNGMEDRARNIWLLSFYLAGMRFGDLFQLHTEDIVGGYFRIVISKTQSTKLVFVSDQAKTYIKKLTNDTGYIIPRKGESKEGANAVVNKYLKFVSLKAEITPLTMHMARHTFAHLSVKNNMNIWTLKGLLGHSKLSTTQEYLKGFYQEDQNNALINVYESLF